jgi:hypothetical protein
MISFVELSRNTNPIAVSHLIAHPDKIDWSYFSGNTNIIAAKYCIQHPEMVTWESFSRNPSIWETDPTYREFLLDVM